MTLPLDASSDQTGNIPPDYYRRNNGMLHQIPKDAPQPPQTQLTAAELERLGDMTQQQLVGLIKRVSGAMWGIGMQTQEERDAAILLKLSILALTSEEAKDVVSTAKEYFDRSRGRPMQSIDLNQKIGIVQIVLEAAKLRQIPPTIDN